MRMQDDPGKGRIRTALGAALVLFGGVLGLSGVGNCLVSVPPLSWIIMGGPCWGAPILWGFAMLGVGVLIYGGLPWN